ncbi:helicase-related protein [Ruminococcus albus]|uniref:Adenine-specific DNA methylase, N12 class n=1 Tax=Ruminococcus albus TaxID=1264 RepID=A0A1I1CUM5_RUMAL|nr:SNF2-related protein [Ruminococcus albus]SFB66254.1 Adenine-specific DNA methylase, N12 class [Ruminococcus albus]
MNNRYQSVCYNWSEVTERLRRDKQTLARFLRFSASLYKMGFPDAALVFYHDPNATKVAELETWNRLGRFVNKGAKSIAVFGDGDRCRHLFDISQTNGKPVPNGWRLTEDVAAELVDVISENYNKECRDIHEALAAVAVDNIRAHSAEMQYTIEQMHLSQKDVGEYQRSVVSAVRFVIANRCEQNGGMPLSGNINLNAADYFKDTRDVIRFCDLVQRSAKDSLLEIEREVIQILRKRREKEHELQTKPDRTAAGRGGIQRQPTGTRNAENSDRQVGQNVAAVDAHGVPVRGDSAYSNRTLEHNPEGDRQTGRSPIHRAGRTLPKREPSPRDIQRNADVGENKAPDDRTPDNGGDSVSAEKLTADALIQRYLQSDFNRRPDSYEIAGRFLADFLDTDVNIVEFFRKHEAYKYSERQQAEIILLIENALRLREQAQVKTEQPSEVTVAEPATSPYAGIEIPTNMEPVFPTEIVEDTNPPEEVPEVDLSEPTEEEVETIVNTQPQDDTVIVKNEAVITTELPPITDENIIFGILRHDQFFSVKKDRIAAYFENNTDHDERVAFVKQIFNSDYSEILLGKDEDTRYGYKTYDEGIHIWKGSYLTRTMESGFSWDHVQILYAEMVEHGLLIDTVVSEIDEPIFAEPTEQTKYPEPEEDIDDFEELTEEFEAEDETEEEISDEDIEVPIPVNDLDRDDNEGAEQLSFFGEPVPVEQTSKKSQKKEKPKTLLNVDPSIKAISNDMIYYVLRCGSPERGSLSRIVAQYQKGKSDEENAEFLRKEFGNDGRGYIYNTPDFSKTAHISSWFDDFGIKITLGDNVDENGIPNSKIPWLIAARRINDLLENGEFCSQDIIDGAAEKEIKDIADRLWYLHQDIDYDNYEYFIPKDMFKGGFPDSTERIKLALLDKDTLQSYIDGLTQLVTDYEQNRDILRFHFHRPKELLYRLKDLQIERRQFVTKPDFAFKGHYFISEKEKDALLGYGSGFSDGKFRIQKYFKEDHSLPEQIKFLKSEYGTGGGSRRGGDEWHDSKGIAYVRGETIGKPDCKVLMKWNEVVERISRLVSEGKYITQKDIDSKIHDCKRIVQDYDPDSYDSFEKEYERRRYHEALQFLGEQGIVVEGIATVEQKPVEKLIQRAQDMGIPVEIRNGQPAEEIEQEQAVFMDIRDESFIELHQTYEGISYSVYAPDLTLTDGGVWEMEESMSLLTAAAEILATTSNALAEVEDYNHFMALVDMDASLDIPRELAQLKADILANLPDEAAEVLDVEPTELVAAPSEPEPVKVNVNAPERITVMPVAAKSGTPITYHFNAEDIVQGGAKSKFKANIEAIKTLQKIEAENRYATPEEQRILAGYVGWGGIPQVFTTDRAADSIGGNLGEAAPSGWEDEQKELRELLSEDEYKAARASTLTSFYTPPEVTDGVFQALHQFGFEGGNILEPSMGVGNFFAKMPDDIRGSSKLYGVELDSISGRIAQLLNPEDRIQITGFEKTRFNNNSFDVVIGNVPFGDYRVSDKAYDKLGLKIHDYFAVKSIDKVKPGGVVAIVTSKFTMDKQNDKARRRLAERCDLLGAVRLPNNAFKKNAGTETTTDILFFKKRETLTVEIPSWVHFGETADGIPCNQYFVDNPDMVLGTMAWDERMKGKYGDDSRVTTCLPNNDTPLSEQLQKAIAKIQGKIETVKIVEEGKKDIDIIPADPTVRNYTHTVVNGKLFFRENEIMVAVQETGKTLDRMMGMHQIRQKAMAVIDAQARGCDDAELKKLQAELNYTYDRFKRAYGAITDRANERVFQHDDDYNTLAALEIVDTEKKTVEKAEIFSKRTIMPEVEIVSCETPQEALQISIDRKGKVDIAFMAELVGVEPDEIISELGKDIYRNPQKVKDNDPLSGYEDASEYLSGNVREKLRIAEEYSKHIDSSFERNVEALKAVVPKDLEASEISVRIGANWVDVEDYNRFMREVLKGDIYSHPITRTRMGEYKIDGRYQDRSVAATQTYGTSRMSSYHILENLLNQRDIVVRDKREEDGRVWYEINAKETQLAKDKARVIKEAFRTWLWDNMERRERYVKKYNDLFNAIRGREYDGSHQTYPGKNPAIQMRPHQNNAIMRGKLGGNTLLAHCVGAGKSFEMVAITMEKRRLGLISKACVVVPKHLTLQMASEWIRLYPNAKLLVARPEDFTKENRQRFIARCVTGDYDAVIMSFNQFERIPMSTEYRQQFMERELDELMAALEEVDSSDRISVKALERQKKKLEEHLEKLMSSKKDNSLCFEKLGFDYLVCDEAHYYKNCFVATKMSNVAGVQTTAAQKSEDMLMKTQYLNDKYGCNNILYATGTPCTNSMVEFYVMQRYLRPDLLEKAGLETFDDWASTFGEVVSQLEIKPAGNGFQMKNRFSKFVNIPELMLMYKEFADIQTPDMIKLPVPDLKTRKPIVISAKPDEYQKEYMEQLAQRAEMIHCGGVDPREDNMLRITHEARLLGLDCRCMNPEAVPAPDSKVNKLLDILVENYNATMAERGVQIVFCDIAINEDAEHFSIYEAIKDDLVKRGIPRDEICFAGDAKTDKARAEMFEQLRQGEKRFILASTSKLGTGANIQDRICAIHHLDIPWKPADLTQQDGRGVRQGNMFKEVGIYHYLTENTFDSYMMGIITNKAKFISQIMTSKDPVRVSEDVDEMVLTYSEMQAIASGNPMIKEKIQLDNDVATLKMLEAEYKKSLYRYQEQAERTLPQRIEQYSTYLEKASADIAQFSVNHPDGTAFQIEIDGKVYSEATSEHVRDEAGEALEKAIIKVSTTGESMRVGSYFGFDLLLEKNPQNLTFFDQGAPCVISLCGSLKYTCDVNLENKQGNMRRIENLAANEIAKRIVQYKNDIEKAKANLAEAKENLTKPFDRADELAEKLARLDVVNEALSSGKGDDAIPSVVEEVADMPNYKPKVTILNTPTNVNTPTKTRR